MILIAIRCDAGKGGDGKERKVTIVINADGELQEVRLGWPRDSSLSDGPILEITPEEYVRQLEISSGEA